MPPYESADLVQIAAALNVAPAALTEHVGRLDGARVFVEFHGRAMPNTPTATREDLLKTAASARRLLARLASIGRGLAAGEGEAGPGELEQPLSGAKLREAIHAAEKNAQSLLKHLGVKDWSEAANGPAIDLADALSYAEETSHARTVALTKTIGDLPPLLSAGKSQAALGPGLEVPHEIVEALEELERIAGDAADEVLRLGDLMVPKGHHGDLQVQGWIEDMGRLYVEVTACRPTDWVSRDGQPSRFIRFLQAAGEPIGLSYTPAAWRRRVRAYLHQLPAHVQE